MQFQEEVRNFITTNFLFGRDIALQDEDSLLELGVIDSTGVLELVSFLETRFGMKIPDTDIVPENLDSVANLTRFVERTVGPSAGVR